MKTYVYIACIDWDMTMRSQPEPQKVFSTKEKAQEYLNKYKDSSVETKIITMELE